MSRCCKRSRRPQFPMGLIFGLALICLGIAFLLNNLHIIYIEDALMFSPLVLIAWGLARLWNKGILNVWGHILVVTGVLLQIVFLDDCSGRFHEIYWPTIIIWIGLIIMIKAFVPKRVKHGLQITPREESEWPGWEAKQSLCAPEAEGSQTGEVAENELSDMIECPIDNMEPQNGESENE